jgi:hypothetical protein
MFRQDYIKRLIEQLSEFLAKIAGATAAGRLDEAEHELEAAEQALNLPLGSERLDARSLCLLLGDGDKVILLVALLDKKAELAEARGDSALARRLRARARDILRCAEPRQLLQLADDLRKRLLSPGP